VSETGVEAIEKGVAEPIVADAIIDRRWSEQLVDAPLSSTALSSQLAEQPRRVAQTVIKNSAGQIE
jgi:hypothetical protein